MDFQLVTISPEGGHEFSVCFNPTRYSIDGANQIAEAAIPGLDAPILQYVHGNARTLSMDLFFDSYEKQEDVRHYTNRVFDLLLIDPHRHVPPICKVGWGSFSFRGVLEHVSGNFTLFLPNGTPARATLSVVFKEYIDVHVLVQARPKQSADHRKTRVVQAGERLGDIAYQEYGDASKWRPIANANRLNNPLQLTPGARLLIPALDSSGKVKHA